MAEIRKTSYVLDLDAVGSAVNAGLSIQKTLFDTQKIAENLMRPIIEAMEVWQKYIKDIIKKVQEAAEAWIKPLTFLITHQPVYYVRPQAATKSASTDKYIAVNRDQYGFFVIAGKKWTTLHPSSSRCGKLLAFLLEHRSQLIDYETLRAEVGAGHLEKDFKDLNYQLRKQGVVLDYVRPRSHGIALKGLLALQ